MENFKVSQTELFAEIEKCIKGGVHETFHLVVQTPVVFCFQNRFVDEEICTELGYDVLEGQYNGGVIVSNKGDVGVLHFGEVENGWRNRFTSYFVDWLKAKGLNAEYLDNDILVDGYKVCGTCITRYGRIDYSCGLIGINTNLDHIKAICRKPMNKVPKGLSEYGITTEEVEAMFLAFCEQ